VRLGMGAMPAFNDELISDDELDALIAYLLVARRSDPPPPERMKTAGR
jgi:hypothetical protein